MRLLPYSTGFNPHQFLRMLQPGTQIGRYEIQRKLARGGMGTVYVAHDPVLGRMVAIKVFVGDLDVPDAASGSAWWARAAASLNHTNIVTIYDFRRGRVAALHRHGVHPGRDHHRTHP